MKLTEARADVLRVVAEGKVTHFKAGVDHFRLEGFWQKPRQSPYVWLYENDLIRDTAPFAPATKVELTTEGVTALEEVDPVAARRRIAFAWAQHVFPDSDDVSRGVFADDYAKNGEGMWCRDFFDTCDYWV